MMIFHRIKYTCMIWSPLNAIWFGLRLSECYRIKDCRFIELRQWKRHRILMIYSVLRLTEANSLVLTCFDPCGYGPWRSRNVQLFLSNLQSKTGREHFKILRNNELCWIGIMILNILKLWNRKFSEINIIG